MFLLLLWQGLYFWRALDISIIFFPCLWKSFMPCFSNNFLLRFYVDIYKGRNPKPIMSYLCIINPPYHLCGWVEKWRRDDGRAYHLFTTSMSKIFASEKVNLPSSWQSCCCCCGSGNCVGVLKALKRAAFLVTSKIQEIEVGLDTQIGYYAFSLSMASAASAASRPQPTCLALCTVLSTFLASKYTNMG